MRDTLVFGTEHKGVSKKGETTLRSSWKDRDTPRTEEALQAQLRAMGAPVPPTQVDSLSERQNKSIKSDTPPNRPLRDPTQYQRCGNNQHQ